MIRVCVRVRVCVYTYREKWAFRTCAEVTFSRESRGIYARARLGKL